MSEKSLRSVCFWNKRIPLGLCGFLLIFLAATAQARPMNPPVGKHGAPFHPQSDLIGHPPISIDVNNQALGVVLQDIVEQSGIEFNSLPGLLEKRITITVQGSSWDAVVDELFQDYDKVVLRDGQGRLLSVYLLGDGERLSPVRRGRVSARSLAVAKTQTVPRARKKIVGRTKNLPGMRLSIDQVKEIPGLPVDRPFPSRLFRSKDYQSILATAEIRSPEEWMNVKKAYKVKHYAEKLLRLKKRQKR